MNLDMTAKSEGDFTLLFEKDPESFAYKRESEKERLTVIANFTGKETERIPDGEITLENGEIVLSNYDRETVGKKIDLRPYECFMYYERRTVKD